MILTNQLTAEFGLNSNTLTRWEKYGWLETISPSRGSGYSMCWADWTPRMVRLILQTDRPVTGYRGHLQAFSTTMQAVAGCLAEDPTAQWIVVHEGKGIVVTDAATAVHTAVELPSLLSTIVAVP